MLKQLVASYLSSILFLGQPLPPGSIDLYNPGGLYMHMKTPGISQVLGEGWWQTTIVANVTYVQQETGEHPHVFVEPINKLHEWYTDVPHRYDYNADGVIDSIDLQYLLSQWGPVDD